MIVDASAVLAVLFLEQGYEAIVRSLRQGRGQLLISPIQYWECWAKVDRDTTFAYGPMLDEFQTVFPMLMVPIDQPTAYLARNARRTFGKGSGHPAALNMGDCFAYALAKKLDKPLLYKGDDFSHTDVRSAL